MSRLVSHSWMHGCVRMLGYASVLFPAFVLTLLAGIATWSYRTSIPVGHLCNASGVFYAFFRNGFLTIAHFGSDQARDDYDAKSWEGFHRGCPKLTAWEMERSIVAEGDGRVDTRVALPLRSGVFASLSMRYALRWSGASIHSAVLLAGNGLVLLIGLRAFRAKRRWQRRVDGLCVACAYPKIGNASGICTECGTPITQ